MRRKLGQLLLFGLVFLALVACGGGGSNVSSERVFPVDSAGPKTFYLIVEENSGVQGSVSKRTLSATYLTAMGAVQNP